MKEVGVVGNVTLDVVVEADLRAAVPGRQQPAPIRMLPGGGLSNVGQRLEELGHHVTALGAVGDDPAGRLVAGMLPWSLCKAAGGTTEVSVIGGMGDRAILNEQGTATMALSHVLDRLPRHGVVAVAYLNCCGVAVADVPRLVAGARTRSSIVIGALNGVFSDERREMVRSTLHQLDVLVLNAVEARWLCGVDGLDDVVSRLPGMVDRAIVTRGEEGLTLLSARGSTSLPVVPVPGGRTLGAGDAFLAGVTAALARGRDWIEAGRAGQAVAAAWIGRGPIGPALLTG